MEWKSWWPDVRHVDATPKEFANSSSSAAILRRLMRDIAVNCHGLNIVAAENSIEQLRDAESGRLRGRLVSL